MKNNKYWAFSLIELMIAISIIGIVSTIAIPSYKTYVIRGQVTDGVAIANRIKDFTINYYLKNGKMPLNIDLAKEFSSTVVDPDYIAVNSVATEAIGYNPIYKSNTTNSYIQLKNPIGGAAKNRFYIAIQANATGSFLVKCGIWNISAPAANNIIDPKYFPTGCKDTDVYTAWP